MEQREWKKADLQSFWGDVARQDHLVQLYENEKVFLDTLEGYVGCAILSGDSVVVLATQKHIDDLSARLANQNFNLAELISAKRYVPVEAKHAMSNFLVNNIPDELLFNQYISKLIDSAAKSGRHVRAFGEMVAELWQQGSHEATEKLQQLWASLHAVKDFSLFCAYPKKCFQHVPKEKLKNIAELPTKIIDGRAKPSTEIHYSDLN